MVKTDNHLTIVICGKLVSAFLSDIFLALSYIELTDAPNIREVFIVEWSTKMYGDSVIVVQPAGESSAMVQSTPIMSPPASFPDQFAMTPSASLFSYSSAVIEDNFSF